MVDLRPTFLSAVKFPVIIQHAKPCQLFLKASPTLFWFEWDNDIDASHDLFGQGKLCPDSSKGMFSCIVVEQRGHWICEGLFILALLLFGLMDLYLKYLPT